MGTNLVLIGFMGAGKTAVGEAIAAKLGWSLQDTDRMVEAASGTTITEIWAAEGEEGFRTREHDAVLHACAGQHRVIACGGGAILRLRNFGILKSAGTVVYLRGSREVLKERVTRTGGRPLLEEPGAFERLLVQRAPAYESAADLIVDVDGRTPEQIADDIIARLS
jgi:shikimate kinase